MINVSSLLSHSPSQMFIYHRPLPLPFYSLETTRDDLRWLQYQSAMIHSENKHGGQQRTVFVVSPLSDYYAGCWNVTLTWRLNCCLPVEMWGCLQLFIRLPKDGVDWQLCRSGCLGFCAVIRGRVPHWLCFITCMVQIKSYPQRKKWPFSTEKPVLFCTQPVPPYILKCHPIEQMPFMTYFCYL